MTNLTQKMVDLYARAKVDGHAFLVFVKDKNGKDPSLLEVDSISNHNGNVQFNVTSFPKERQDFRAMVVAAVDDLSNALCETNELKTIGYLFDGPVTMAKVLECLAAVYDNKTPLAITKLVQAVDLFNRGK